MTQARDSERIAYAARVDVLGEIAHWAAMKAANDAAIYDHETEAMWDRIVDAINEARS